MYTLKITVSAALGGLLFGYDTSVISGAILFLRQQFHLSSVQTEVAVSIVLAGAVVGAALAGYLGDRFGRKPVLIADAVLFAVFSVLTGATNGLGLFLVARFMVGLAVGVTSMITPLYIAEVAPPRIRGALVTLNQLAIITGIVVAYGADYFFAQSANWRAMFISAVFPSIILLFALIFLPESPRWMAAQGHFDEALALLSRLENPAEAQQHIEELREVTLTDQLNFRDLYKPRFRKAALVGVGLAIFQQLTGINTIIYYTPTILLMAGFKNISTAILTTVLMGGVNLAATILSLLLLDRVGRRPLLLAGITGMALSLTHLGYAFNASHVSRVAILLDVMAYLACFSIGLGPVVWLLISEIYPTTIRAQAMSLASVTIWICDLMVTMTFLSLIEQFGARFTFWFYAAMCIAALLFCVRIVPETKGRTLEEIEASW